MELANYGEYSGAPTESQTFEYAKTLLKLMTEGDPHPDGKPITLILYFCSLIGKDVPSRYLKCALFSKLPACKVCTLEC
jgi:hypothetical protein